MPRRLKLAYYCLCTWILMFSCRSADWLFRPPPYCDVKIRLIFADHKAILHDILWFPMQPYILTYVMICFGPCNLCKRIMHNTTFCTCMHGLRWTGTRNMVKLVIEKPGYFSFSLSAYFFHFHVYICKSNTRSSYWFWQHYILWSVIRHRFDIYRYYYSILE